MESLFEQIANCVERGKVDRKTPYPPDMKDQDGSSELTQQALNENIAAAEILNKGLMVGMKRIGEKFGRGEVFIPDVLIAAKAMNAAMEHLRPYFDAGDTHHKGTFVIGTVNGDLHDIGKNLVRMVLEGDGWNVIDLGVDVSSEQFVEAVEANPGCMVGLSALLTTTMINMEEIVQAIKDKSPQTKIFIGGAPVTGDFNDQIGADGYFKDPQKLVQFLNENMVV